MLFLFLTLVLLPLLAFLIHRAYKESLYRSPKNTAVLITGCDTGIGFHSCLHLLKKGVVVFAGCLTEKGKENLEKEAQNLNGQLFSFILDVTKQDSVNEALLFVEKNLPSTVDNFSLFNNAGIAEGYLIGLTPLSTYRHVMEVNYFGFVTMTKTFLHLVRNSRKAGGRILNLTSMAGVASLPSSSAYSSSKFATEAFTDALRLELKSFKIPVVLIEPTFIRTPICADIPGRVDRFIENGSPEVLSDYGGAAALREFQLKQFEMIQKTMSPIEDALGIVDRAYLSVAPHIRYQVGHMAKPLFYMSVLPSEITDWIVNKIVSYPWHKK